MSPIRLFAASLVLGVVLPAAPGAATEQDVRRVTERIVCYCGCSGLTVADCACGTADAIRGEVAGQLDTGLTPDEVVAAWVAERGEQILAVPTREGFNLVGWVMPFVVTAIALATLTAVLLRRRGAPVPAPPASDGDEAAYLERIEREMRAGRG